MGTKSEYVLVLRADLPKDVDPVSVTFYQGNPDGAHAFSVGGAIQYEGGAAVCLEGIMDLIGSATSGHSPDDIIEACGEFPPTDDHITVEMMVSVRNLRQKAAASRQAAADAARNNPGGSPWNEIGLYRDADALDEQATRMVAGRVARRQAK